MQSDRFFSKFFIPKYDFFSYHHFPEKNLGKFYQKFGMTFFLELFQSETQFNLEPLENLPKILIGKKTIKFWL